jgi:hypothetical protein
MSNEKPEKSFINFMVEGLKLEWGTPAGRYNVLFTGIVTTLVILYSISNTPMTLIYAYFFKEKYPILSLWDTLKHPIIWGGLCFTYMVAMSHLRYNVSNKLSQSKEMNEDNVTYSDSQCTECDNEVELKCD